MAEGFVLSTKDKELLQRMVRAAQLEIQSGVPSYDEFTPAIPQVWYTPAEGIPARTGTYPYYTFGKAECTAMDVYTEDDEVKASLRSPELLTYIYNTEDTPVEGNILIRVYYLMGRYPTADLGGGGSSRRANAILDEDMIPSDDFVSVVSIVPIAGEGDTEPIDAANVCKWYGKAGNACKIEYNPNFDNGPEEEPGGWELYAIEINYTLECPTTEASPEV